MPTEMNADLTTPSAEYRGDPVSSLKHDHAHAVPAPRRTSGGTWIAIFIVGGLLLAVIAYRLIAAGAAEHRLEQNTRESSVPVVRVVHPTLTSVGSELALPGNTAAYNETAIYARTNGYLKHWFVDIGQHVSRGELMAIIESPEVDEQLQVAQANLKSTQADLALANTTSERYVNLLKSDSVSRQETDVAVSGAAAKQADVDAAEANVRRLQQLQSFEHVVAPFSGIVTVRNTDIGDLINAGSSTGAAPKELFRVAAIGEIRVYVAVPETYAPAIHDGDTAALTLDEYQGQQFVGKVARNSNAIDPASRTLNVEVDVDNPQGKLLPGAYVFVHFHVPQQVRELSVPANTLLFRAAGTQVGIVRNGRAHLQQITIGKDNGSSLQIATGLSANDEVILDPSDSLTEGQPVHVSSSTAVNP